MNLPPTLSFRGKIFSSSLSPARISNSDECKQMRGIHAGIEESQAIRCGTRSRESVASGDTQESSEESSIMTMMSEQSSRE